LSIYLQFQEKYPKHVPQPENLTGAKFGTTTTTTLVV